MEQILLLLKSSRRLSTDDNSCVERVRLVLVENAKLRSGLCGKYTNRHFQLYREESSIPTPQFSNSRNGDDTCS